MRTLATLLLAACLLPAQTLEDRIRALEEGSRAPEPAAREVNDVQFWYDGHLRFRTKDHAFTGSIGAYVVVHGIFFDRLNESDQVDTIQLREAGLEMRARLDRSWEVYVDIGPQEGTAVRLIYGWVEFNRWPELRLRAGLFKEPISLETLEDTRWWDFPENSIVYMHAPLPDLGFMVHGRAFDGFLGYAAGVFNGAAPGPRDENSDKDVAGRVQLTPSAVLGWGPLAHLHVAASATHGRHRTHDVTPFPFQDPATDTDFHRPAGPTDYEVEDLTRLAADGALLLGPLEVKAEYSRFLADIDFAGEHRRFRSTGWYVQAGGWIGGRRIPGGVPEVDAPLFSGGWGALQGAFRYARLRMEDDFRDKAGFIGARSLEEFAVVVNWFPNEHVRVTGEYLFVSYESGHAFLPSGRRIADESVWIFRVQISF
ncbi:MAG: hypothetical protein HUU15_15230 [Candidatus Brocadiae bacterium]|nr:hypothetical protein [Candidatus Brocadiia bacterium]